MTLWAVPTGSNNTCVQVVLLKKDMQMYISTRKEGETSCTHIYFTEHAEADPPLDTT